jgi:hypothetical protein
MAYAVTFRDRVVHLANDAMLPRNRAEKRLGVDADIAALRVLTSKETVEVQQEACSLLRAWAARARRTA